MRLYRPMQLRIDVSNDVLSEVVSQPEVFVYQNVSIHFPKMDLAGQPIN